MKPNRFLMWPIALSIMIVFVSARNAYAYIDPGTGSYILMILLAAIAGSAYAVKVFWLNIKEFGNVPKVVGAVSSITDPTALESGFGRGLSGPSWLHRAGADGIATSRWNIDRLLLLSPIYGASRRIRRLAETTDA